MVDEKPIDCKQSYKKYKQQYLKLKGIPFDLQEDEKITDILSEMFSTLQKDENITDKISKTGGNIYNYTYKVYKHQYLKSKK